MKSIPNIRVCVLLCCYNGEKYIKEQILSIINQVKILVHIYISDDSSSDNTYKIIKELKKKYPKNIKKIYVVKNKSAVKNFVSLTKKININYKYYAFSDQDDIWLKDKLYKAINTLNKDYDLYCSRTTLIDDKKKIFGYSNFFDKNIVSFNHALVQSIAGGNTMVFNNKILRYLKISMNNNIPSHDWWTYIITTFSGGKVFYDNKSYIYYRQHEKNLIGHNTGLRNKFKRFYNAFFKNLFLNWNAIHVKTLKKVKYLGTFKNQKILKDFTLLKKKKLIKRIIFFIFEKKIYRQSFVGNVVLLFLIIFKKF